MQKILIIEDDTALAKGVQLALTQSDRSFTLCHNLADARTAIQQGDFSLLILDVGLPDGSGLDFCHEIRPYCKSPVLFLTAADTELDIVSGLELGGDDYMTKPFSLAVLRARVNVLLRRSAANSEYVFGELSFDFERLIFQKNVENIELSKTEQRLLHLLTTNAGQTIPRERLLDYIWSDSGEFVDENALSVAISRLRSKLGDEYLKTVRGIGYRWDVK